MKEIAPKYTLENWGDLGWTISAAPGYSGVPVTCLGECIRLFGKKTGIDPGISTHLIRTGHTKVCFCMVTAKQSTKWRKLIKENLAHLPPEEQWWLGTDTGKSSASIFGVLAQTPGLRQQAKEFGEGNIPRDGSDFSRCLQLLEQFPEWAERLPEVAAAYPGTGWPEVIQKWEELKAADHRGQYDILQTIPY